MNAGEEVFAGSMSEDTIKAVILALEQYEVKNVIVCGKSAYIHENAGEDEYLHASKYYYVLKGCRILKTSMMTF